MSILEVEKLSVCYEGKENAVNDLSFSLESGELMGLIGPNGAGKSTTIRAILGLINKTRGEVRVNGENHRYGYIPEHPVLYKDLTLWEHLELLATTYEIPKETYEKEAGSFLSRFDLSDAKHHLPVGFSKGMKQKVMLMIAFLMKPDLYIVDEPFIGLDPKATKELIKLLNEEKERGAGILMCTHVLDTAEKICDTFLLLDHGQGVAQGDLKSLQEQAGIRGGGLLDCFDQLTS
ncbi:ABC-2 type transport system ATP-binding protein [Marininema mesophilum]|uniref:ABC-2 type transport system ATP-binding protein n=1 Tax=Marininema mesophilum TaxID=1048340 RepID=A0A1H2ZZ38_9BACL|nr:ABC transporter ATP-binding protein [Marininema mesophilum]SDX22603.1 ABC-2 type transport system ATP-binding protein [Marininema mesophilum]